MRKEDRERRLFEETPVFRAVLNLAFPTVIGQIILVIYNMADTFFVGRINTSASGAVGVIFSAMAMIQAIAFTIGIGSRANMSQCLGAKNREMAERYVSLGFFTALLTGTVLGALALVFIDPLVRLLGATETIAPYARAYATYIFYATPFIMSSFVMNNLLRFQGLAAYAMVGMTTGGLLNIALDPLLIFTLGLGTAGAAIATAISQFVSFCILLYMSNSRKDTIHISLKKLKPTGRMVGRMLYTGLPSLGRQGVASVATILLNRAAGLHGDSAVAAMSIVSRYTMFINSAVVGFGQGFQPVCAFCWGARQYRRVREAFLFCVKVSTVILLVLAGISQLLSGSIVQFFRNDPEVVEIGTLALRLQLCTLPLWGLYTMSSMMTQSIGYGWRAMVIASARQGLFLIPLLLVLPNTLGLLGIQSAQPASDVLSFLLALLIVLPLLRRLKDESAGKTL